MLVSRGMATLHELETTWSFDDVKRGVAILRMRDDIEVQQLEDSKNDSA